MCTIKCLPRTKRLLLCFDVLPPAEASAVPIISGSSGSCLFLMFIRPVLIGLLPSPLPLKRFVNQGSCPYHHECGDAFLAAKATKRYKSDSKQFRDLLRKDGGVLEIRDMALGRDHLWMLNSQLIMNNSAHSYITLKENTSSALLLGYQAWNKIIHEAWEHKEEYEKHYHRRSVVEGIFNAFKERFGKELASKIRRNQNVDVLRRV
jgi:hypothetical protein